MPTDPLLHAIPDSQRSALVGVVTAAGAAILWGGGTVATFVVLDAGVSTSIFTIIEIGSSIVFLTVMSLILGSRLPSLRKNARVGALGILEPGLAYVLMNFGLERTSVTHAALLGATEPALIALLAWFLIGSKLPRRLLLPMGTALIGTVLVVTANVAGSGADWFGDVLIALGFVSASLYAVGSSRVVEGMKPLTVAWIQQIFAFAIIAPPLILITFTNGVGSASSLITWLAIPVIGVTSSSLTFWL
ncbi:MAG: DMT family transporter, partial [Actinomycetes bacterium]